MLQDTFARQPIGKKRFLFDASDRTTPVSIGCSPATNAWEPTVTDSDTPRTVLSHTTPATLEKKRTTGTRILCPICMNSFPPNMMENLEGKQVCSACRTITDRAGARTQVPPRPEASPAPFIASGYGASNRTTGSNNSAGRIVAMIVMVALAIPGLYLKINRLADNVTGTHRNTKMDFKIDMGTIADEEGLPVHVRGFLENKTDATLHNVKLALNYTVLSKKGEVVCENPTAYPHELKLGNLAPGIRKDLDEFVCNNLYPQHDTKFRYEIKFDERDE
jgi:hypothetical protein